MIQIKLKRIYEEPAKDDGFRVFVDHLWPRGMKKENVHYDLWAKDIAPSTDLRKWFHEDPDNRWDTFFSSYQKELSHSDNMKTFVEKIKDYPVITLLYGLKDTKHNHALIIKDYLEKLLKKQ